MDIKKINKRREFIKNILAGSLTLTLGIGCDSDKRKIVNLTNSTIFIPNAWLRISSSGEISIYLTECEMGQGVMTALPMLVAEELEANWSSIKIIQAPVDSAFGWQGTGGSTSIREAWEPLRKAGAAARIMLIKTAAALWSVSESECYARDGRVFHSPTRRKYNFSELAPFAADQPVPDEREIQLKDSSRFRLIGNSLPKLDTAEKINGSATFGMDIFVPDMAYATIIHCPVFGGRLASFDDSKITNTRSVKLIPFETSLAIVADAYWKTLRAKEQINIKWVYGKHQDLSSQNIEERFRLADTESAKPVRSDGRQPENFSELTRLKSEYFTPYQAHATMEPMCCTAIVSDTHCEVWAPTQQPTGARNAIAQILDILPENIIVNTTFLGGGFGRRNLQDFVIETVQIARMLGKPVKLIWSREEDIQHDFYHPASYHKMSALVDNQGMLHQWQHVLIGPPYTEGAIDVLYECKNIIVKNLPLETGIPLGPWRSVSHSFNAFAIECFIDELAEYSGLDPIEYRIKLLENSPRAINVLAEVAKLCGWQNAKNDNTYLGVAFHYSFGTYVAQVVELSKDGDSIKVSKVYCCIDCGVAIHPDIVKAQIEGSIIFALTATIKSSINISGGRVTQSNFHDFPLLTLQETPEIQIHILKNENTPGGIGEPGVPPLAPAVLNALHRATGKRYRQLPVYLDEIATS